MQNAPCMPSVQPPRGLRSLHRNGIENLETPTVMKSPKSTKMHRPPLLLLVLAALALIWLATGCSASLPTTSPSTVPPPRLAPLQASARQTPAPPICSPSCSDALTTERESWRTSLIPPAPVARPANAPTTAPAQ